MPTKITKRGFFSDEALQWSESIKYEHKRLFFHLDDLNEKAHIHLSGFPVGLSALKLVFTAALFMRALTAYQALIFPFTLSQSNQVRLMSSLFCDVGIRYPNAFAVTAAVTASA